MGGSAKLHTYFSCHVITTHNHIINIQGGGIVYIRLGYNAQLVWHAVCIQNDAQTMAVPCQGVYDVNDFHMVQGGTSITCCMALS